MGVLALTFALFKSINFWVFGAFFLALSLGVAAFGQRRHERYMINLGLAGFAAEILYIYFKLFGTKMQTSLFFLIGGLVLIALAFAMTKLSKFFQIDSAEPERRTKGETS